MTAIVRYAVLVTGLSGVLSLTAGCEAPPRRTTLTLEDYDYIAAEISEKLAKDLQDQMAGELTADQAPKRIAIRKIRNYTSDVLGSARWMLMEKVADNLTEAMKEANVRFVIPEEHLHAAKKAGTMESDAAADRDPTHVLEATFRTATRLDEENRAEHYQCAYRITSLQDGTQEWSGMVVFTRWGRGVHWD